MIIDTQQLHGDLVKRKGGFLYRRFGTNQWERFDNFRGMQSWNIVKDCSLLEKEYKIYKNNEYQEAFLNAP